MSSHSIRYEVFHLLEEQLQDLESTKRRVTPNREIPHDLTCHIPPPDQHTPRAHTTLLAGTKAHSTVLSASHPHQSLATLVCPAHHISHGFHALSEPFENGQEFHFEKLDEIFMTAIATEGRLVPYGLEVDLGP